MKLIELIIENFLGIESKTAIAFFDFSVLVGRNDVGKSTILKALDLFLNDKTPSTDIRNINNPSNEVIIEAIFDTNNQHIIIDETIETTFMNEELVDEDGYLRIRKVWDLSQSKPKSQLYIYRKQYQNDDFIFISESQLIKICQSHEISTHKANGTQCNNVEKRDKLRDAFKTNGVGSFYTWEKLPSTGANRQKLLFDAIKECLPRFEYFKADSSLSEADTSIQNYFREIATNAIGDAGIKQVEDVVRDKLCSVLNSIASKINSAMPNEAVRPGIEFDWSKTIKVSFITGEDTTGIPLSMRGDGFRRVTMMSYFEHLAEEKCEISRNMIFGFEEPETFLHPKAQEQLFDKLQGMAENNYQIVITTHSPIIVANSRQTNLIHVIKDNGRTSINYPINDLRPIANDLGITSDNQFYKLFEIAKALLLVEGIDDAVAYEHVSSCYKNAGIVNKTFNDLGIILLPIGGCGSIKHWIHLELIRKLTKPWFIFLDSDKSSSTDVSQNKIFLRDLGLTEGDNFYVTKRRNLENYISCSALNRLIPEANLIYNEWDNVKDICKRHPLSSILGGKNVAEKYFCKLTYSDLKETFCDAEGEDEFVRLYNKLDSLISE